MPSLTHSMLWPAPIPLFLVLLFSRAGNVGSFLFLRFLLTSLSDLSEAGFPPASLVCFIGGGSPAPRFKVAGGVVRGVAGAG